jgi:hypothetical protein
MSADDVCSSLGLNEFGQHQYQTNIIMSQSSWKIAEIRWYSQFSEFQAKKWVHDTQVCIQTVLLQNYTANHPINCSAFRQYGFKQHKKCSIDNGICDIFWDNKFTLIGVLDAHNFR